MIFAPCANLAAPDRARPGKLVPAGKRLAVKSLPAVVWHGRTPGAVTWPDRSQRVTWRDRSRTETVRW